MLAWIPLVPAVPLISALVLATLGTRLPKRMVSLVGVGSIGVAAIIAILGAIEFLTAPPAGNAFAIPLWIWMPVGVSNASVSLYVDSLSLLMAVVVAFVSFFIHLYSTEYMADSEGYSRFFAYMNLFVGSMVTLVLAGDLLLLFLGWEGVGLCSYLLIGFWYQDPANGRAAQKAFIVTRVGDIAFTIALLLIFTAFGVSAIPEVLERAQTEWPVSSGIATAAAILMLGGAVGKSAQLPLQTWLPDAMAGPTPTSALIHAATMVTAGVYLIARMHPIFQLAPVVMGIVAVVGAATMLIAGCSALVQVEIKRILAYSTVSQIGYMFLALGVGAWSAAMFHLMTHAFFKSLLFLAAGVVIDALHHENNIFRMGGLRRELPWAFWSFLIGGAALAGLPWLASGFYSKDLIIWRAWASPYGNQLLWIAAIAGVFLTSLYTFRMIFVVFWGDQKTPVIKRPGPAIVIPLAVLSIFAVIGGWINLPHSFGHVQYLDEFLSTSTPLLGDTAAPISELTSGFVASAVFLVGLGSAWWLYGTRAEGLSIMPALHRFFLSGWGFDWLYDRVFVRPVLWIARVGRADWVDPAYSAIASGTTYVHRALALTQNGQVRWYAAGLVAGSVIVLGIALITWSYSG
jgi:NADH-quinone oxidoreductase subunit L